MNKWSHLPNAAHIDRILAELKANPDRWRAAFAADAWDAAWDTAKATAKATAWDTAKATARPAARGAILALIAYDDCAYLLNEKPEDVHMFALLGQPTAILLYPACLALSEQKEKKILPSLI